MKKFIHTPTNIRQTKEKKEEKKKPKVRRSLHVLGTDKKKKLLAQSKVHKFHRNVPAIPPELVPDCANCKTSACCSRFIVELTQLEHESGLYAPYSVEIPEEVANQLKSAGFITTVATTNGYRYILEGALNEMCPFFDNGCTIYNNRPYTCRSYSCVNDPRITQEDRDGK